MQAASIIGELEKLLSQFFDSSNYDAQRKVEIEKQLTTVKEREDSWQIGELCFASKNPMIIWFGISIYDHLLRSRWGSLHTEIKKKIPHMLFSYLIQNQPNLKKVGFVEKPLCNIIVRIGKSDWPHDYPNFISDVLQAVQTPATCEAGLLLIRQIAEEFAPNNIKLPSQRKIQLTKNFKEQLPTILNTLRTLLEREIAKYIANNNKSPDNASQKLSELGLEALLQFLGWIPMNDVLNPQFLGVLFKFIHFYQEETSLIAFSCVNEILGQNFVPKEFSEFMINIFNELFRLLESLTKSSEGLHSIDENYVDKFTQFTSLFVSLHLRRVEKNSSFPIIEFLSLLYQYTFMQTSLEGFLSCLEIWETFLDYIIAEHEANRISSLHERYADGMAAIAKNLSEKVLFHSNEKLLSQLSDESSSVENNDSELDTYRDGCLNIIGKVAQLYSSNILGVLWNQLQTNAGKFLQIHQVLSAGNIPNDVKEQLIFTIKDMETLLKIFDHVATGFACVEVTGGCKLLQQIVEIGNYIYKNQLQDKHKALASLTAQLFATLRAYVGWKRERLMSSTQEIVLTVTGEINLVLTTLSPSIPVNNTIVRSSIRLLDSLGQSMPVYPMPQIQQLIANTGSVVARLSGPAQIDLYEALISILLVPVENPKSINWEERMILTQKLINQPIIVPFTQKVTAPNFIDSNLFSQASSVVYVNHTIKLLSHILERIRPLDKKAKQIIHEATKDAFPVILGLFRVYFEFPEILKDILQFLLKLFAALHTQIGIAFAQQTISLFTQVLWGDQIKKIFANKKENEIEVVKYFLELLSIIISFPSSASTFQSYISPICNLCTTTIYPIISESADFNDVKIVLFELQYTILDCHWNYCVHELPVNTVFNPIIAAFLHSFTQTDLSVFKNNLQLINKLNKRLGLFKEKANTWGNQFINTLFIVLLQATHNILQDEIIPIIYDIAAISFESFYNQVLPAICQSLPSISDADKQTILLQFSRETDIPSFTRNVQQMIEHYQFLAR